MNLGSERDPNVGLQEDGATFTIPRDPVRHRIHGIQTFNVLRGGEYFFMPSLSALRWIGSLPPPSGTRWWPSRTHGAGRGAMVRATPVASCAEVRTGPRTS